MNHNRPTYPQFEAWIKLQPGAKLDKDSIDKTRQRDRASNHDDETRRSILATSGIPMMRKLRATR
jgi:hypothetical protein